MAATVGFIKRVIITNIHFSFKVLRKYLDLQTHTISIALPMEAEF